MSEQRQYVPHETPGNADRLQTVLEVSAALDQVEDLDSLLDRVLTEARAFANADSGTIYLVAGDRLRFAYNSHSTQRKSADPDRNRFNYLNNTIPINDESIAGYVAHSGKPLVIDDAYRIGDDVPYSFNQQFDREADYRTQSMLTLPLKSARGRTVGVLQLINALDSTGGEVVPFSQEDMLYVLLFSKDAASAIERASMTRQIILRMIRMSELRDPKETGAHVSRVAAYSVEIYERWARTHGVLNDEMRHNIDLLRLAAMMHDVGKIAIPDEILKKPGRLTDDERLVMQTHAVVGARLFSDGDSDLDNLSREITLHHHERWDGNGYPGRIDDIYRDPIRMGPGLKGREIPLFARIVGLADVYDALVSRRTYKEPWGEDQVLDTIRSEEGKHFSPDVVKAFFDVHPVLLAIRRKYTE
ncbi:HD domain-containing phosphohydrolase [Salinispira pacifica]